MLRQVPEPAWVVLLRLRWAWGLAQSSVLCLPCPALSCSSPRPLACPDPMLLWSLRPPWCSAFTLLLPAALFAALPFTQLPCPAINPLHHFVTRSTPLQLQLNRLLLLGPADGGPLRRFVTRSTSFAKEDFDKLLQNTGMFRGGCVERGEGEGVPPGAFTTSCCRTYGCSEVGVREVGEEGGSAWACWDGGVLWATGTGSQQIRGVVRGLYAALNTTIAPSQSEECGLSHDREQEGRQMKRMKGSLSACRRCAFTHITHLCPACCARSGCLACPLQLSRRARPTSACSTATCRPAKRTACSAGTFATNGAAGAQCTPPCYICLWCVNWGSWGE